MNDSARFGLTPSTFVCLLIARMPVGIYISVFLTNLLGFRLLRASCNNADSEQNDECHDEHESLHRYTSQSPHFTYYLIFLAGGLLK